MFAMGDAFKNSGYVFGIVQTLLFGFICAYNIHLLVAVSKVVKKLKDISSSPSFPETISYAFEFGHPIIARTWNFTMFIMKAFVYISQLGFCVVYISFFSWSIMTLVEKNYGFHMNIRLYVLCTFPLVLVVSLIPNLKGLAPISAISLLLLLCSMVVTLVLCSLKLPDFSSRNFIAPVENWPLSFGTIIFAFAGITLAIPIRDEMKNPKLFESTYGVLNVGMWIYTVIMIVAGILPYWKYGDDIIGSVTFSISATWLGEAVRICVAVGILLSYPIQFYAAVRLCLQDLDKKWGPFKNPLRMELYMRAILVILTYFFALVIPYIDLVISIIGAVSSNALGLFFPSLADISLRWRPPSGDDKDNKTQDLTRSWIHLFLTTISIILSVLGVIIGGYISIMNIVLKIKKDLEN